MKAFTSLVFLFALPFSVAAQCNTYFPYQQGTVLEYTEYNTKDKVEGMYRMEVTGVSTSGARTAYTINVQVMDKKGREEYSETFESACTDGVYQMDLSSYLSEELMNMSEGGVEVSIDPVQLAFPGALSVGDRLPDGGMTMTMTAQGMEVLNMKMTVSNRRVTRQESITTPAGTFSDALVVESDITMDMKMAMAKRNMTMPAVEYIAPGVGMVRSESFDQKGRPEGYRLLTHMENVAR